MRFSGSTLILAVLTLTAASCASTPAPSTPAEPKVETKAEPPPPPPPPAASAQADAPYVDPDEKAGPIDLPPLHKKAAPKGGYPKATAGDRECWQRVNLSGDHKKDYEALMASCGSPTGMIEYVKPATGRLHHKHDKRDSFSIKLKHGHCYRYFAVADASADHVDIQVTQTSGALVETNKNRSPVAILRNDGPWCVDEDVEYHFHLDIAAGGQGQYVFAVWERPAPK